MSKKIKLSWQDASCLVRNGLYCRKLVYLYPFDKSPSMFTDDSLQNKTKWRTSCILMNKISLCASWSCVSNTQSIMSERCWRYGSTIMETNRFCGCTFILVWPFILLPKILQNEKCKEPDFLWCFIDSNKESVRYSC